MTNVETSSPILATVPLGPQWQTLDPFLFCAHHDDAYPPGNGSLAPAASLAGRAIGNDFSDKDGWSMYHGSSIPGFPQHPHRGFETITFARRGNIDHSDSMGATARFGRGDVQWMTAGRGIVHSEMFPLVDTESANHTELFQVWLNLPAADKMVEPYFTMFWAEDIPLVRTAGGGTVTVIAGQYGEVSSLTPPPNSWAARDESNIAFLHVVLPAGASASLEEASTDATRVAYQFVGEHLEVDGHRVAGRTGAQLVPDQQLELANPGPNPVEILVLQGRPIGEPVAKYGPFVMNTDAEIQQAFDDYQRTQFGGWPWPADGPAHDAEAERFAVHADGRRESPPAVT